MKKVVIDKIFNISIFLKPVYLNISISLFSNNFIKKVVLLIIKLLEKFHKLDQVY